MNTDHLALTLFIGSILVSISVTSVVSYNAGRTNERKALHEELVKAIEETYWDGYTDAITGMRKVK